MSIEIRPRASAVILRDKKLLLVTIEPGEYYFTPGGKIEAGESREEALARELQEELSVQLTSQKLYMSYSYEEKKMDGEIMMHQGFCFIVEYNGEIRLANEVSGMLWYSRADFENGTPKVSMGTGKFLVPKLIEDNLL